MRFPTDRRAVIRYLCVASALAATAGLAVVASNVADAASGTLLSKHRPVMASSTGSADTPASNAVDGDIKTVWTSTNTGTQAQWIVVDLGRTSSVSRVNLTWAAPSTAYQIQVSDDQTNWTAIATTTKGVGGTDNLTGLSGSGQYLRLYGLAAGSGHGFALAELRVYGRAGAAAGRKGPAPIQTAGVTPTSTRSGTTSPAATSAAPAAPTAATTTANPPAASGECHRQAGTSSKADVSEVNLGAAVTGYAQEADTDALPMAIAATPSGTSWLAWLGTDSRVHLGKLDCDDKLVGTPTSFDGIDLQDVSADANGGVILLTRKGTCNTGPLCGGTSSPCNTMVMVRFDTGGHQVWERQVTNLEGGRGGYDDGARFVWWYQHHGRLATDGTNYAAYFGVAITVKNGNCVDIHEGDRMQVVNPSGALLSGHDSFDFGCSHAWTSRIAWDQRTGHFAMVCATDNNCRIAQPNPYRTISSGTCDGTLFGGDLVLSSGAGYWTAWSHGGQVRLAHFSTGVADSTVSTSAQSSHPHLVSYGSGRMLLAWESGSGLAAQVYESGSGKSVAGQFSIGVKDHSYLAFKSYADGSTAYPAAGSTNTSIRIARVMPMA